jgi:hypothetical protein
MSSVDRFRLYVDEVGNHHMGAPSDPNQRYLSLTGLAFEDAEIRNKLHPSVEAIKERFFASHPDDPVILHRKALATRKYPFAALREPGVEEEFNGAILSLIDSLDYTAITVVIDKSDHRDTYGDHCRHPYHYCMRALVERYANFLNGLRRKGDVIAEARGGKEDKTLAEVFREIIAGGSEFVSAQEFTKSGINSELVFKRKTDNIAGLQLADLIAHPAQKAMIAKREGKPNPTGFAARIIEILENKKWRRSSTGKIDGFGRKWLP